MANIEIQTINKTSRANAASDLPFVANQLQGMQERIKCLRMSLKDANIDEASWTDISTLINKEQKKYVDLIHSRKITPPGESRKYWWTKIKVDGKKEYQRISAKTKDRLYEKLYEHYTKAAESLILRDIYKRIMPDLRGSRGKVADKTKLIYSQDWNKYFENKPIADMKITDISSKEWRRTFNQIIEQGDLTEKQFKQVLIIINHIINYCIANEYITASPIIGPLMQNYPFRKESRCETIKTEGLSEEQIKKVIEWCNQEMTNPKISKIYIFAMLFNLRYGLRIGELRGLKWSDIDGDWECITIRRQYALQVSMKDDLTFSKNGCGDIDHNKAYEQKRPLPLNEHGRDILLQVKALNLPGEYIFPLRQGTYSAKIKEAARYAGVVDIDNIHPHTLRSAAATTVYLKRPDAKVVQKFLGHTTPTMSNRYIKGIDSFSILKEIL